MHEHTSLKSLPPIPRLVRSQFAYHMRVLLRTPRAVIGGMLLPVLLLILRNDSTHATIAQHAQLTAGLATFGVLSTAYITHASSLVASRQAGVLKRWRAAPLPAWCYFAGRIATTTLLAAAGGFLTALAGTAVYHIQISITAVADLMIVLMLGAATWASIGTAASTLIPTVEAAWPLLGLTYLPLVILSGSFGTVDEPAWLAGIIKYLPVRPIIDSLSRPLDADAGTLITAHDLLVLIAWAAAGILLSQRFFCWTPATGRRRSKSQTKRPAVRARQHGRGGALDAWLPVLAPLRAAGPEGFCSTRGPCGRSAVPRRPGVLFFSGVARDLHACAGLPQHRGARRVLRDVAIERQGSQPCCDRPSPAHRRRVHRATTSTKDATANAPRRS